MLFRAPRSHAIMEVPLHRAVNAITLWSHRCPEARRSILRYHLAPTNHIRCVAYVALSANTSREHNAFEQQTTTDCTNVLLKESDVRDATANPHYSRNSVIQALALIERIPVGSHSPPGMQLTATNEEMAEEEGMEDGDSPHPARLVLWDVSCNPDHPQSATLLLRALGRIAARDDKPPSPSVPRVHCAQTLSDRWRLEFEWWSQRR